MSEVLEVLIEGFDPNKLEEEEDQYDKTWKKIVGAYQNQTIIQGNFIGIEDLRQPKQAKKENEDGKESNEKSSEETKNASNEKEATKEQDDDKKYNIVTCAVVQVDHVRGYIPIHEFGVDNKRQLRAFTGRSVVFKILKYDRENEIFIGSRVKAREQMAKHLLSKIKEGDEVIAVVNNVTPSLVRADIGGIDVKIPIDEIRYGWIDDLTEEVKVGDHLKVKILEIDKENQKVKVSRKALLPNPFPDCLNRYKKGSEYIGTVSGVREYGVFVNLEPGVDSLARHLKYENVKKGDKVLVRILDIEPEKEHISVRITRIVERG